MDNSSFKKTQAKIEFSLEYAMKAHAGQRRKRKMNGVTLPYIFHPIEVAKQLWKWGTTSEDITVIALLHDVLEDCPNINKSDFQTTFGNQICKAVEQLTHYPGIEKSEYLKSFKTASIEALTVKIADRYCNIRDFLIVDEKYANIYKRKSQEFIEIVWERSSELEKEFGEIYSDNMFKAIRKLFK